MITYGYILTEISAGLSMQISEIQAFVAICDQGSFRAAASEIHITQPAISKRLSSLEARLGHRLFDRVGRGSVLTEAGQAYLPHARRLLLEVENSNRALDNLSDQVAGHLGLALSHHVALHRIPPVLQRYVLAYPEVDIDIEFLGSETACQAIASGRLDLAIITLPEPVMPGLEQTGIWRDELQILVAPAHPLAQAARTDINALNDYPALLPEVSTFTYRMIAKALQPHGVVPDLRQSSNYLETLKMLATAGLGWTVLPASMANNQLQKLQFPNLELCRNLGVVRHPQRSLSNAAQALLGLLQQQAIQT